MQKIKLTNMRDAILASAGHLAPDRVRSAEIDALIDTGATTLIIPEDVAALLGLTVAERRKVKLANGQLADSQRVTDIKLEICGRDMPIDAFTLPAGTTALVGQIPLEALDLVVDPRRQELRPNPAHPDGPIVKALRAEALRAEALRAA